MFKLVLFISVGVGVLLLLNTFNKHVLMVAVGVLLVVLLFCCLGVFVLFARCVCCVYKSMLVSLSMSINMSILCLCFCVCVHR